MGASGACGASGVVGWLTRASAADQFAEDLLGAGAFARVIFVGNGAGLAAEFEAEERIFQFVEALLYVLIGLRDGGGGRRRLRACYW